ncbi:hypothetical protein D3C81_2124500 [compost metagenome]
MRSSSSEKASNLASRALIFCAWAWKALTLRSLEEPRIFLAKPSMGDPVWAVERLKALKQEAS